MTIHLWRRRILLASLALAALALAGCAGGRGRLLTGSSWPGVLATEETIYVSYQNMVYAIDPDDGTEIWRFETVASRKGLLGGRQPVSFYAEPAVNDGLLVVGDYNETVHALDAGSGQELWTFVNDSRARFVAGATIEDGVVFIGDVDGTLFALDASTGTVLWTFVAEDGIWDSPIVAGSTLYFSSLDHKLYALRIQSGSVIWSFDAGGAVVGTPTLVEDVLYFGSFDKTLRAIEASTGRELWSYQTGDWIWDSPAISEGVVMAGDLGGNIYALDSESGQLLWEFQTDGPVVGTPTINEGTVYFGSEDTRVYALDLQDGSQRWAPIIIQTLVSTKVLFFDTGSENQPVPIYGPPLFLDDKLIVGIDLGRQSNLLQSLSANNGQADWAFSTEEGATQAVSGTAAGEPETAESEEPPTTSEQIFRLLPMIVSMTLLTFLLFRRKSSAKK